MMASISLIKISDLRRVSTVKTPITARFQSVISLSCTQRIILFLGAVDARESLPVAQALDSGALFAAV